MVPVLIVLYILLVTLLLRITIAKKIFQVEYEFALKHGKKKKAKFYGFLYYSCLSNHQKKAANITIISAVINNDLETYLVTPA